MSSPRSPIACSTVSLFSKPLDHAFPLIAETGFDGIEVMVTSDPDTQDAARIRELSQDYDLPVVAVHAPFLMMSRRVWGTDPIGKIGRSIELARGVGSPVVVVHPPYRWQAAYRRWLTEDPATSAEHAGPVVAVENMFPLRVRGRSVLRFHARQSLEGFGDFPHVALDTSHLAVTGLDPLEILPVLADRLAHVHLSNNAGKGWDSHLPLDDGVLDLERFLEALGSQRFGGAVSLEIDLRKHMDDERTLRRLLLRNRDLCEDRLSRTS